MYIMSWIDLYKNGQLIDTVIRQMGPVTRKRPFPPEIPPARIGRDAGQSPSSM
jgi:hypothetical protein